MVFLCAHITRSYTPSTASSTKHNVAAAATSRVSVIIMMSEVPTESHSIPTECTLVAAPFICLEGSNNIIVLGPITPLIPIITLV
jgi:hypothetical protein